MNNDESCPDSLRVDPVDKPSFYSFITAQEVPTDKH